jgi:hypothetical protein
MSDVKKLQRRLLGNRLCDLEVSKSVIMTVNLTRVTGNESL